ncbi:uncharacterized protein EAE97_003554 [Botrytis byssoidea]|uniref:Uncharacterized protein n=1 Tax=Botrytis byssoidea TaxID=139641 RepID=A0A9P5IVR3_9HELO|nr:uncharacterized protein EAE97_003554 [Botrytis byssoidea]KAF7948143.1 hypothetical protein EAE97_003554 [Botrytis byssoidea]
MQPGSILQNYTGPMPDYGGTPNPRSKPTVPMNRRRSSSTIKAIPRRGQTLADDLADFSSFGNSSASSASPSPSSSDDEFEDQVQSRNIPETPLQAKARQQTERLLERHNKYIKDHNVRTDVPFQAPAPAPGKTPAPAPAPLSKAQKRFSQTGNAKAAQPSSAVPLSKAQKRASQPENTGGKAKSSLEEFISNAERRVFQTEDSGGKTKASPAVPLSKAQKRASKPENTGGKAKSYQQPPRSVSMGGRYMPVDEAEMAPRRVPAPVQTVKPPPLSDGLFATISREYGWDWLWWLIVPLVLLVLAFYASRWAQENELAIEAMKMNVEEAKKGRFKVKAERANGEAVVEIVSAISDVAKISLDENGTLGKLTDSPFNQAVLPIEALRKEVVEAEGKKSQPLLWNIDKFVDKNREVDHAWRSFLEQQIEATAELTGIFDGYAMNAGFEEDHPNWIRAAHNITHHDFTDIPQKTYREGEQILCQILGKKEGPNCPTIGKMLIDVYNDLKQGLEKPGIKVPPNTFETYSAATTNIAKAIKSVLKGWEKAADRIEAARLLYKDEHAIGNVERVDESLDKTSKALNDAMWSSLVERIGSPEYPTAVRRLAEAKVWIKKLQ